MKIFRQAYRDLSQEQVPYYRTYTHDSPLIMSLETFERTKQLGVVLHKAINYFVENYAKWLEYFPLSDRDLEILSIASKYPFRAGSYRTDFIITPDRQIKIIEMTTRFPLNGFIISGFTHQIGIIMAKELGLSSVKDLYTPFLEYLSHDFAPTGRITVIKGNDRMGDYKVYSRLFAETFDFRLVELAELHSKRELLRDTTLIEELNLDEIRTLPNDMIEEMCRNSIFNDLRNLFLIHDKRFFQLLTLNSFLDSCLTSVEKKLLAEFTIPSYTYAQNRNIFQTVYQNKDHWIVKPYNLGKSEGVVAGSMVTAEIWQELFDSGKIESCILQPMIEQRRFKGTIGKEQRNDYVAGTLLYMDDQYYGPGLYRASSFVVTNQKDDRKMAQVVADVDVNDYPNVI